MTALLLAICLLLPGSSSQPQFVLVDLIELNHFIDDKGVNAYDQVILYEWSPDYRRYHVQAWFLLDTGDFSGSEPRKMPGGWHEVRWREHTIRSRRYRETWSTTDPERANKQLFDERYRRWPIKRSD